MGRSSRQESSHKAHASSSRDARQRSDSEEEETSRERKSRETSVPADSAKKKSSSSSLRSLGKGVSGAENGGSSHGHGPKKKARRSDFASAEEQGSADEVEFRVEDLKVRSGRRSEKEYCRNEGREKNQESRRERLDDGSGRKRGGKSSSLDEDHAGKRDGGNEDWEAQEEPRHAEPEKHTEKSDSKLIDDENNNDSAPSKTDKHPGESKGRERRRSRSREARSKSGSHRDDRHRDKHRDEGSQRDKYRDNRSHQDKYRDERDEGSHRDRDKHRDDYSRERSSSRSHSKHYREEKKSEKRSRHHDSDYDGGSPYRDGSSRGRKRHSDERDDAKPRGNLERSASNHLDAQDGHPKGSPPPWPGEGSSFPEERDKRINESAPLTEKLDPVTGSSPLIRGENFSGGFPGHVRFGMDSPGLASLDDGGGRYKRGSVDLGLGRAAAAQGLWKGGVPPWPAPGINGFLPFQPMPPPPGFLNQCPPSLFGVRPGVPFQHLHEPRPFLWPGHTDGWDDSPAVPMDDPRHMYGRQPATWEPKARISPAPPSESALAKDSVLTRSPEMETVQNPFPETEVAARSCCAYLSKLDISLGLAGPELYRQCIDLVRANADVAEAEPRGSNSRVQGITSHVAAGSRRHLTDPNARLPPLLETVYEKAMSFYKKQSEDWKAKALSLEDDAATMENPIISENLANEGGATSAGEDDNEGSDGGAATGGGTEEKKYEEKGLDEEPGVVCVTRIHGVSQSTH
ncbi:uncharacterized protein LOC144709203 [Wolffia australiana]